MQSIISALLFILSLLNGHSHNLNIIIKCFIPPDFNQVSYAKIILINEYVLCLLLTACSPKGMVLIIAKEHLFYAIFAVLVQFNVSPTWIHVVAAVWAVQWHLQPLTRSIGYQKKPRAIVCCSWLWKRLYANSIIHQSWVQPQDCPEFCYFIMCSQGQYIGRICLELNTLQSSFPML